MLIVGNGQVITRGGAMPYLPEGAVVTEGSLIKELGSTAAMREKYPQARFVDAQGGVIMPGLINAHTHIYSGLARGLSISGHNPHTFYQVLDGMWWNIDRHLDLEGTRASAYATIIDCIKNGVTTIFDHHASYREITGSLFAIRDVAQELGIRACLCYEVSERDGAKKCDEAIEENAAFAQWAAKEDSDMIKAMFGGHALFTLSDQTFEKMARANDGLTGYHIHVCEGSTDRTDSWDKYNMRPIDRLAKHGILGEKTILGHCIELTDDELDVIAETNTMCVTNPESNMGNAVGVAPVLKMFQKGILVGLGTDAYTHDMLESLKVELIIQRHNAGLPNVGWQESTGMLFENNPKMCTRYLSKPVGVLAPGALADIAVFDYHPFTPFGAENVDGHILYGFQGKMCLHTVINGQLLMENRVLTQTDEEAVYQRVEAAARRLWGELNP
ncbi:MAG: putative aminohydrolase SsnA [Oscillospiraceae bacterium]|nr:putative aminohydrolase SsnA [Oscillospiraceae bacterium]